jgi:hypothetical protein
MEKLNVQTVKKHYQKISEDLIELYYVRLHDFIYINFKIPFKIYL